MSLSSVLPFILASLLLKEGFLEAPTESQTVVEGQDLSLDCVVAGDNTSALQWTTPHHRVIFFGRHRGVKDKRYQLINSSMDRLSILISNITTDDEGLYTCHHYAAVVRTQQVNVTILAAPSKPLLEKLTSRGHGGEEIIVLRCSTWRSKPPPQITWLLDNGIELFGDIHHQCEGNGGKCNTTSTLKVHTFNQKSAASCVVRHKALGRGNLTATVHVGHISNVLNATGGEFGTQRSPLSREAATPVSTSTNAESDNRLNTTEGNFGAQATSARNETVTQNPNSTRGSDNIFDITQGSPRTQATPTNGNAGTLNYRVTNKFNKILNVTEGSFGTQPLAPRYEDAILNSNVSSGTNLTHERIVKKPSKLLPILVAALLSVLSVIVLLFSVKLWKAHREWKRENESSDLTVESYKAGTNEDNHAQENRHVVGWTSSKKRAAEGSWRTSSKNSEESKGSVFEKQLPYIKETDL